MHRLGRIVATVFVVALLVGCLQGNRFDPALVSKLKPGISTEQDAIRLLGKPSSVGIFDGAGDRIIQWYFAYGNGGGSGASAHAAIIFAPDERMIRVSALSEE